MANTFQMTATALTTQLGIKNYHKWLKWFYVYLTMIKFLLKKEKATTYYPPCWPPTPILRQVGMEMKALPSHAQALSENTVHQPQGTMGGFPEEMGSSQLQ